MSVDSTFDMEKKRNRVQKYDREKMATTLKVMKKVQKVREQREQRFYERRMKVKKQQEKTQNKVEIKQKIWIRCTKCSFNAMVYSSKKKGQNSIDIAILNGFHQMSKH